MRADNTKEKMEQKEKEESRLQARNLRVVLLNAIKMQALYSNGRIKYVETSSAIN